MGRFGEIYDWNRRNPVTYRQLAVQSDSIAMFSELEPDPPQCPIYLYDNEGTAGSEEQSSEYVTRARDTYASEQYRIKRAAAARVSARERKNGAGPRNPRRAR